MHLDRLWPSRTARVSLASLAIALLGGLGAASPAAALPANFWGVVPQAAPTVEQLQRLKRGGVGSIRIPISWGSVQPIANRPFNWSEPDALIATASAGGLEVLPFLSTAPGWAVPFDRRFGSPRFLPVRNGRQRSGWKNFVTQAIRRYGSRGTFWSEHPELPRRPIRVWQIWNEPNFKYFVARPDPAEYGKLINLTYAAAKSADRRARLVLGGLFARPIEATSRRRPRRAYFAADFLQQMYERTPGIRAKFQGIGLHPYTGDYKKLPSRIEEVRRVLRRNRDGGKAIYITELGWSSQPPTRGNSFAKGPRGQVKQLKGAFHLLRARQRRWRLQRVFWFSVDDYAGLCNFCNGTGLFASGFVPKASWYAYARIAGGNPN